MRCAEVLASKLNSPYFHNMQKLATILIVLVFVTSSQAQTPDTLQRIDQLFSRWNNATPGLSVAIERQGKIIYHKAFGLADLEHNVPNTVSTVFEAGSVSKQFTAAAILLLVQEGKISLDDDVRKYVPELPVYNKIITIRHLMNHTSGLKDWGSVGALSGWPRTTRVYTQDLALQIICKQKSLNFTPGSEYSYSNSGYTLMVSIVERVSKQSLAEFTRTRLFEPAGLKNTQWRDNFREVIPNRAVAYRKSENSYAQEMPFENIHGHGGLLTTTEDLITWNHQLENPTIGGVALRRMRTEQGKLTSGKIIGYSGGLFIQDHNGIQEINHTGATASYRAVLSYFPEKKLSIAILSNDGSFNPGSFGTQVAEIFLGKKLSPPEPVRFAEATDEQLQRYAGTYRSVRNFDVLTLRYEPGKVISNGHTLNVIHPDTLYFDRLYWIRKKNGQLLVKNPSDTNSYVRVKPAVTDAAYFKSVAGLYVSDEADAVYQVEVRDGNLWVSQTPPGSWKLTPSFYDGFVTEDRDLYEFKRSKKGTVNRLEVSVGRAERIIFVKVK